MNEIAKVAERTLAREVARLAAKPELTAEEIEALVSTRTLATTHQSTLDADEIDRILNNAPAGSAGRSAHTSATTQRQPEAPGKAGRTAPKEEIIADTKFSLERVEERLAKDPALQAAVLDEGKVDAVVQNLWERGDGRQHFERPSLLKGLILNRARRGRTSLATGGVAC